LLAALTADYSDQVGTAELQIVFLAKFEELLQVNARHKSSLVAAAFKYLRVNGPRPIRELQPVDASPVFHAVNLRRRGETLMDPLLGQLDQCFAIDVHPARYVTELGGPNHCGPPGHSIVARSSGKLANSGVVPNSQKR
jgi:hypothetical protein